ncbi:MAG: hypothetical protein IT317_21555 [Anaerolineales bacterium]|nr:hypothetical protein [Anaerolineales bacterium]
MTSISGRSRPTTPPRSPGGNLYDDVFDTVIAETQDISERFEIDLGGVPDTIRETSQGVQPLLDYVRECLETHRLPPGQKSTRVARLVDVAAWVLRRSGEFAAHYCEGRVAAVDGTPLFHPRRYLSGQVFAVAVGALTARDALQPRAKIVRTSIPMQLSAKAGTNAPDLVATLERMAAQAHQMVLDTSWPQAFLEYHVRRYALEHVRAPYILVDGPLAPELVGTRRLGRDLLSQIFHDERVAIGVVKSLLRSPLVYRLIARALRPGEAYVVESQRTFLRRSGTRLFGERWIDNELGTIWRGLYRPGAKTYAFQCRAQDFEAALCLLWCDRDEVVGHELPFLLNQVDHQLQARYRQGDIEQLLDGLLAEQGEDVFFDEMDERLLR